MLAIRWPRVLGDGPELHVVDDLGAVAQGPHALAEAEALHVRFAQQLRPNTKHMKTM